MHRSCLSALVVAALSCGGTGPKTRNQSFEPGAHVVREHDLRVELVSARYEQRSVTLRLAIANRGKQPAVLGTRGILLAYGDLEYPLTPEPGRPIKPTLTVPPGKRLELNLPFQLGHRMAAEGHVRLRDLKRATAPLEPVSLAVPAAPPNPPPRLRGR